MTWPPRWDKAHFKTPISTKVVRGLKRKAAVGVEDKHKRAVRRRDLYCRFPLCGCKKFKLRLDVSHAKHKGMGGNPKGDRSLEPGLILLCSARHKDNAISVDRGTLRIKPLVLRLAGKRPSTQGLAGPCAWLVDINRLREDFGAHQQEWLEVARETARHVFEPFTPEQEAILKRLAGMEL